MLTLGITTHTLAHSYANFNQHFSSSELPDLGTAAVNTFSLEKENQLGDAYMRVIRGSAPILYDPVLNQYLTELGNRLVANATDVKTPFYFFLLKNNEINAFAFFGGHVGVHSGLFLHADSESELASVLAHEITHVTQRHLARSFESQQQAAPATIASMLGAILLTIAVPQAGMAALATTQALSAQTKINFTRQHEQEADRIGIRLLANSGFDPRAAAQFFNKLAAQYRYTTKPPQMLLTHPLPESRITEARNNAAQYPVKNIPDNLNYQLAKTRISVRYSDRSPSTSLAIYEQELKQKKYHLKQAALYGKALALYELNQFKQSSAIIDQLLQQDPNNLFYLDTKSDLLAQQKEFKKAEKLLKTAKKYKPTSPVIDINLANIYIEANQPQMAIPLLEQQILANKQNPLSFSLLSKAYSREGNKAMAYFAQAENLALGANYKHAIEQLNLAYKATDDRIQQARIATRINQFKQAQQELDQLK